MSSGIRSLRRLEAVDLDGQTVGILLGYTDDGDVAIGIAGPSGDRIVLLNRAAQGNFLRHFSEVASQPMGGS